MDDQLSGLVMAVFFDQGSQGWHEHADNAQRDCQLQRYTQSGEAEIRMRIVNVHENDDGVDWKPKREDNRHQEHHHTQERCRKAAICDVTSEDS